MHPHQDGAGQTGRLPDLLWFSSRPTSSSCAGVIRTRCTPTPAVRGHSSAPWSLRGGS